MYGLIPINKSLFKLIDTPQFQRMRSIKQLGTNYLCFPDANHTRFNHSLGTAYLAGRMLENLNRENDLGLGDQEKLVIQAAALLHDIGHGPFSHVFENEIVPRLVDYEWNHEQQGLKMIDYLINDNQVDLFDTSDVKLIKSMITGTVPSEYGYVGQVISNHEFGIDVDRLDYIQRDCHAVGINCGFDPFILEKYTKLFDNRLAYHVKRKSSIFQLFHSRYTLYRDICNHHISKAVEYMLVDALVEANGLLRLDRALEDPELYTALNDNVLDIIRTSTGEEYRSSKDLLRRIDQRKFYKMVGTLDHPPTSEDLAGIRDPIIHHMVVNYGLGKLNPLTRVPFFEDKSEEPFLLKEEDCKMLLPSKFEEEQYRIFSR